MYISIDIGGTTTRVAGSLDLKTFISKDKFPTPQNFDEIKQKVNNSIIGIAGNNKISGLALGVPGMVDRRSKTLLKITNVPSLSNISYKDFIDFDVPNIVVENDAAMAGLAEATLVDERVAVYLTLSTGVGGVRIVNKELDLFTNVSEPGHCIIVEGGRLFEPCGQQGCASAYCSATAFNQIYGEDSMTCVDPQIWSDYANKLSALFTTVISMWAPNIIILGGRISTRYDEHVRHHIEEKMKNGFFELPKVSIARFGDDAGLYGGLVALSKQP